MERLSPTSSESYSPTGSRPDACGAWSFKESAAPGEVKLKSSSVLPWTSTSPTPQTPSCETGYSYTAAHVGSYNTVSAARSILLQATRARATDNISAIRIFFILSQDASPWQIIAFGRGNSTIFNFFENFSRKVCGIRFLSYLCIVQTKRDNKTSKSLGSLAQLVQSVCLTSRGSGVRLPQLPQKRMAYSVILLYWSLSGQKPSWRTKHQFCQTQRFSSMMIMEKSPPTASRHVNTPAADRQSRAQSQGFR